MEPPRRAGALAVAALATIGFGCSAGREDTPTAILAMRADVTGFFPNPPIINETYTFDVNWSVFEGLVRLDSRVQLGPALAERWENPDDRTCLFELHRGLRFSDGRPVTAEDVAASLEAALSRGWVTRGYLQAIESVRALDERRVEVRTRFPYPILLFKLPWGLVLPKAALSSTPVRAVGTGPYRLESWNPGKEFVLVRNPYFRGPPPALGRARFVVVPDAGARVDLVVRGEADVADQVPLEILDGLRARPEVTVHSGPGSRVLFLMMRVTEPPFSDPRVRQALDLALDREELSARVFHGRVELASQIVPSSIVGYNPHLRPTRPDRARARQLLHEAGYARPLSVRLDGPSNRYPKDRQILEEVARQFEEVGVRVEVQAMEKAAFFARVNGGQSSFHLIGWACQSGEAGDALDALLHSRQTGSLGNLNSAALADPELDRLIDLSNGSADLRRRAILLQEALARVAVLRPVLPLIVQTEAVVVSRRVRWDPPMNYAFRLEDLSYLGGVLAHPPVPPSASRD